jgi:hypothetical protein
MLSNLFELDTPFGTKSVELHAGDLMKCVMECGLSADLIVVSSYQRDYSPTPGSVIGALNTSLQIDVKALSTQPAFDLRKDLGLWLSKPLQGPFGRLACVDILEYSTHRGDIDRVLKNLFGLVALMQIHGMTIRSLATPLLGTGQQQIPLEMVIGPLVDACRHSLESIPLLSRVFVFERNPNKVAEADRLLNTALARTEADTQALPSDSLSQAICSQLADVLAALNKLLPEESASARATLEELSSGLRGRTLRFFALALLARRVVEAVITSVLGPKAPFELFKAIDQLSAKGIAPWVVTYLHTLRVFGNFAAHDKAATQYRPPAVQQRDFSALLIALSRATEFWMWWLQQAPDQSPTTGGA